MHSPISLPYYLHLMSSRVSFDETSPTAIGEGKGVLNKHTGKGDVFPSCSNESCLRIDLSEASLLTVAAIFVLSLACFKLAAPTAPLC
ncbi:hypothetical protein TNCT_718711 [Trichonephila clavata]|uniref:Uncharacterized protein n=1 Tax=Trichonephila clavata TaxID=2740835 RepID=A0A8X6GCI7_TRICU|nr:hypothetical protein TNCT_718711 [Trichonephila clavata]